jgi:hypothetical protein
MDRDLLGVTAERHRGRHSPSGRRSTLSSGIRFNAGVFVLDFWMELPLATAIRPSTKLPSKVSFPKWLSIANKDNGVFVGLFLAIEFTAFSSRYS